MKVNMTPNPLDVVTIHASQGDTEARQWEFELHNNGELIDTSDVKEQLVFKAYKSGTEQILPENGSVPVTAPFIGDIQYHDGLRTEQEFLYRESPTNEDGQAKIIRIKGNTVVWNQLIKVVTGTQALVNLNVSTNSDGTITVSGTASATGTFYISGTLVNVDRCDNDTIYVKAQVLSGNIPDIVLFGNGNYVMTNSERAKIVSNQPTYTNLVGFRLTNTTVYNFSVKVEAINLTKLGLPNLTKDQFEALYWLPYYSHNAGSLLSFNGNGIKTVGKNLFDEQLELGTIDADGNNSSATNRWRSKNYIPCFPNTRYVFSKNGVRQNVNFQFYDADKNYLYNGVGGSAITTPSNAHYLRFFYNDEINVSSGLQLEFGTTPSSYEPYTSSTSSLPISTYFPTGMKSAGNVYDELTESKAITRIGSVDLGSLNWTYQSSSENMYVDNVVSNRKNNLGFNAICSKYQQVNEDTISGVASLIQDKSFAFQYSFNGRIIVRDTSYTDATVFKQAMADQNVKLYYELAAESETSFTTASLVTENAEIPLSNEDGVLIGKCTEELSAEPGFHDAKIKLSDSDGTCYSNKLQLHIERSPQ